MASSGGADRSPPPRPLVFAFYLTGHGFGHATRAIEVVRHLVAAGHEVHVATAVPEFVFTAEVRSPRLRIRRVLLDCGAVQADALTVDPLATLEKYREAAVVPRESILRAESEWLSSIKADLVVSDVVPVVCRVAADMGARSVCIGNFSWDFIYAEYIMEAGYHHRSTVWQIAEDYAHCDILLRLPGYGPMPAFRNVIDVPLIVRGLRKSRSEVRKELGLEENAKVLVFNFGGQVVAQILQDTAIGKECIPVKFSGARRLQNAIVSGYQLQRAPGRDVRIPDWYSLSETETGAAPTSKNVAIKETAAFRCFEDFEILHGDLQGLTDTMDFLKSLSELNRNNLESSEKQYQERTAASVLFDWEKEIYIARAPGRLDVMGGIADYSGSLVLQMPLREACHVAVQRNHPSKQKLWKHTQARQLENAGLAPVIQIVSFGSELSNRAPTFYMRLSDFMDGEKPIPYEKAREFFCQNPSQKWAAYVAGTILVLMTELGVQFTDSMSILVSSAVPEGKGVSSSASVEVATMSAIAAAYGLNINPRDLALLCQKVENHVVGAPCGVMDQMASACGEANKLLAMVCQPAEVKELVSIPTHMRFWGLDSGIRHSVGGGDYGSVRVGTYMGRKMIKCAASDLVSESLTSEAPVESDCHKENGMGLLKSEAAMEYLCNLPPHRYEAAYAKDIPEVISGDAFLEKYGDHNDKVTVIDPKRSYSVKAPTRHPIYENFRVETFKTLLAAGSTDEQLSALGELMYQCHNSYSACDLGSDGTDRLVNLVQEMQHRTTSEGGSHPSLFGAKITGGGSGGTVCVIGKNCARSSEEIVEIQKRYKAATGYLPILFDGSSPGAAKFGYLKIRRRRS
ncbi:L-arabinokinase-like isoform X1 [Panicum miliaceum]|uniref:L-arabinokinase-like isoform X1 n=1 Tax=Panicum miliaceum TaxID=4540 RepID=A0A3L6PFU3_PANMI|nr:L-arabinokinase-like isoform X1 [Panicum miliaceum]